MARFRSKTALAEIGDGAGGELSLTAAIQRLLSREPVFAYRFEGRRFDCSSKLGFLEATVSLALEHPELGEGFAKLLRRLERAPAEAAGRAVAGGRPRAVPAMPH